MSLFDNGKPEEFLLLICNFSTTLAASGTLEAGAKFQYLFTLVCGEALHKFDSLWDDLESTLNPNKDRIIRDLAQYFPPVN